VVFGLWNSSYFNVFAFRSAIVVMQCLISKLKLFREYLNIDQRKTTYSMVFGFVHFHFKQNRLAEK
jgi:hypothetical protein